jgi:hypothetical protein
MPMGPADRTRPQKVQKSVHCLVLCLAAFAALARGCGDEQHRPAGTPNSEHAKEVGRNPYSLTCGDLARQSHPEGARLVIRAQAALTREPALRRRVRELGLQRANQSVYFALTQVCKRRDPSFKPARLAVERVRSGTYRSHLCIGPGCSEEVRWLAARVAHAGRVIQLVTAHTTGASPAEVEVRMDNADVGLALRLRVPEASSRDVRLHCAEVDLGKPVGKRKIVDDGSGQYNPFDVSVRVAEARLAQGQLRCVRVPSI